MQSRISSANVVSIGSFTPLNTSSAESGRKSYAGRCVRDALESVSLLLLPGKSVLGMTETTLYKTWIRACASVPSLYIQQVTPTCGTRTSSSRDALRGEASAAFFFGCRGMYLDFPPAKSILSSLGKSFCLISAPRVLWRSASLSALLVSEMRFSYPSRNSASAHLRSTSFCRREHSKRLPRNRILRRRSFAEVTTRLQCFARSRDTVLATRRRAHL